MGQLVMTVGGGILGGIVGGPFGAQIGMMIGGALGSALFGPTVKGPRLSDLTVTTSTYGNGIPELYATSRMSGNVIWSPGIVEHKVKSGGLAGKGGPKQTTYTYTASFAVAFCAGPADSVARIWADGKLIVGDATTSAATGSQLKTLLAAGLTGGVVGLATSLVGSSKQTKPKVYPLNYRFYRGDETQMPDGIIVADKGADNTPAYRGLCYIVFDTFDLTNFGNRIPSITAEITKTSDNLGPSMLPLYGPDVPSGADVARVDWLGGKFYIQDNDDVQVYDLNTMTKIATYPFALGSGYWMSYNGGPIYIHSNGGANTTPLSVYDGDTFQKLAQLGRNSTQLGDQAVAPCQIFSTDTMAFTNNDKVCGFNTVDAFGNIMDWYFLHYSIWGTYSVYTSTGAFVMINQTPSTVGTAFLQGRTDSTGTDVIGWTNKSDTGFCYHRWTFTPGAQGSSYVEQTAPDCIGSVMVNYGAFEEDVSFGVIEGYTRFVANICLFDPTDNTLNLIGTFTDNLTDSSNCLGFIRWSIVDKAPKVLRLWNVPNTSKTIVTHTNGGTLTAPVTETVTNDFETIVTTTDGVTTTQTTTTFGDNGGSSIVIPTNMDGSRLSGGTLGWITGPGIGIPHATMLDLQTGAVSSFPIASFFSSDGVIQGAWDDVSQSLFATADHGVATRWFFRSFGGGTALSDIVRDICLKTTALTVLDIDATALSAIQVPGYVISNNSSAKDCLSQLSTAYFFDGVEIDYKLKFVLRGSAPTITLTEDDLAPATGTSNTSVKETSTQETELPMRVTVNYFSQERDYQTGSQFSKRRINPVPTMYSASEEKMELPLVLTADAAKQITDKGLKMTWTNRTSLSTTLPWAHILLDPTDPITINLASKGVSYGLRIDKLDIGVDYSLQVTAVTERSAAYTSAVTGNSGDFVPAAPTTAADVNLYVLNTPLLRDLDDTQGNGSRYYLAVGDKSSLASRGAIIEQSKTGEDYSTVGSVTHSVPTATVHNTLGAVTDGESTDWINTLRIIMHNPSDTLESISYDDLLDGGNAAYVGGEIIQFLNAEQGDDGVWTLSGLLRGRRGTQYAIRGHEAFEDFVLLEAIYMDTALHATPDYVSTYGMKAVPPGGTNDSTGRAAIVNFQPNDLKPYTPENLKCTSAAGVVSMTFNRRSRITATLTDGTAQIPYKEGQGITAHFVWQVFFNADINDPLILAGTATPDETGTVNVYSGINVYADLVLTFPFDISAHGATPGFVIRVWEVGFVDGFPKIAKFTPPRSPAGLVVEGTWNYAELY